MQFLLIAYDYKDSEALDRRMAARPAHVELSNRLKSERKLHFAAAILDVQEKMIGSTMILEFPTQADLDQWLAEEPYITGNVWEDIKIQPCRIGPSFVNPT